MTSHWMDQPRDKFGHWTDDGSDGMPSPSRSEIVEMIRREREGKDPVLPKYRDRIVQVANQSGDASGAVSVAQNNLSEVHDQPPAPVGKKPPRMVVPYTGETLGNILEGPLELRGPPYMDKSIGGYGNIGAPRKGSDGLEYGHSGADLKTKPGEKIFAPYDGEILYDFDPYNSDSGKNKKGKVSGLRMRDQYGEEMDIDYIKPNEEIKKVLDKRKPYPIKKGDKIGNAQDLSVVGGKKGDNRAHVQMWDRHGNAYDPLQAFFPKP